MLKKPIIIRRIRSGDERELANAFVAKRFYKHYRTQPHLPPHVFAAFLDDRVVGTLGFVMCKWNDPTSLTWLYEFGDSAQKIRERASETIEFSRWAGNIPLASIGTAYAVIRYALSIEKRWGLSIFKDPTFARARAIGTNVSEITDTHLRTDRIPESDESYFSSRPIPRLYSIELRKTYEKFDLILEPAVRNAHLVFMNE